jgi:hypothetical protein
MSMHVGSRAGGGRKNFQFGECYISWHHVEQVLHRERVRDEHTLTRLTTASVFGLDSFAKMRVGLAKACMDARVACEMLDRNELCCDTSRSIEDQHRMVRFSTALQKVPQRNLHIPTVSVSTS